jgi:ketosteroid isomerase-like protein
MSDSTTEATLAAVNAFNAAFNDHDVDAVMALMTDDVVFETTGPAPDGKRYVGQADVRAAWEEFFSASPTDAFTAEEIFANGDRCVVRWRFEWNAADPSAHVRGVDVIRVRDGKLAEKLAYVKG